MSQGVDIFLNKYLELITTNPLTDSKDFDNVREINVYVTDDSYNHYKVLTIINYGGHVKIIEHYESPIGETHIEKIIRNAKPSEILRLLFSLG
jgi:hypothetical protein